MVRAPAGSSPPGLERFGADPTTRYRRRVALIPVGAVVLLNSACSRGRRPRLVRSRKRNRRDLEPYDDINPRGELITIGRIVEWVGPVECAVVAYFRTKDKTR